MTKDQVGFKESLRLNTVLQFVSMALLSCSGLIFWVGIARYYPAASVGQAAALLSVGLAIVFVCNLGLDAVVALHRGDNVLISTVLFQCGLLSMGLSSLVAICTSIALKLPVTQSLRNPLEQFIFVAIIAGASLSTFSEMRILALGNWRIWLLKIVLSVGLRLTFLLLLISNPIYQPPVIMFAALAGESISALVVWFLLVHKTPLCSVVSPISRATRNLALASWVGQLAVGAPTVMVPVIVSSIVSNSRNSNFFLCWSIATALGWSTKALGRNLLVQRTSTIEEQTKFHSTTQFLAVVLCVTATFLALPIGWIFSVILGDSYRDLRFLIPILVASNIPWAFFTIDLVQSTTTGRLGRLMTTSVVPSLLSLIGCTFGVLVASVLGASIGFLIGSLLAVIILQNQFLRRNLRRQINEHRSKTKLKLLRKSCTSG